MALGYHCAKCGHQEVVHLEGISFAVEAGFLDEAEDADRRLRGYRKTLSDCFDYKPSKKELRAIREFEKIKRREGEIIARQGAVFLVGNTFCTVPDGEDYGLAVPFR